jgi:hypothetical protein
MRYVGANVKHVGGFFFFSFVLLPPIIFVLISFDRLCYFSSSPYGLSIRFENQYILHCIPLNDTKSCADFWITR